MDDLISRKAAIDEIKDVYIWHDVVTEDRLIQHMKNLPSADAVEVVRCKDCKYWIIHPHLGVPWCREMHIDRGAEDFCSMAERR